MKYLPGIADGDTVLKQAPQEDTGQQRAAVYTDKYGQRMELFLPMFSLVMSLNEYAFYPFQFSLVYVSWLAG